MTNSYTTKLVKCRVRRTGWIWRRKKSLSLFIVLQLWSSSFLKKKKKNEDKKITCHICVLSGIKINQLGSMEAFFPRKHLSHCLKWVRAGFIDNHWDTQISFISVRQETLSMLSHVIVWKRNYQSPSSMDSVILTYIYICSITDVEHLLFINIEWNTHPHCMKEVRLFLFSFNLCFW